MQRHIHVHAIYIIHSEHHGCIRQLFKSIIISHQPSGRRHSLLESVVEHVLEILVVRRLFFILIFGFRNGMQKTVWVIRAGYEITGV